MREKRVKEDEGKETECEGQCDGQGERKAETQRETHWTFYPHHSQTKSFEESHASKLYSYLLFICRENRYLLFLTENYAALQVIKHYLHDEVGLRHVKTEEGDDQKLDDNRKISEETTSVGHRMEPFVLFGSSFPKDREYTQVCRNINQIKICMETGRTVILLNLENLYESLYDLLNQYYIHLGDQRYVDLGLQTHRVKCRVHNNFK